MNKRPLILENLCFEPERLPDGIIRGALRNPGAASTPPLRLALTFLDESDRITGRIELPVPPVDPGASRSVFTRYRLKNMGWFRYEARLRPDNPPPGGLS